MLDTADICGSRREVNIYPSLASVAVNITAPSVVDGLPNDPVYQCWETLLSSQDLRLYSCLLALISKLVLLVSNIRAGRSAWGLTTVCSKAGPRGHNDLCSTLSALLSICGHCIVPHAWPVERLRNRTCYSMPYHRSTRQHSLPSSISTSTETYSVL